MFFSFFHRYGPSFGSRLYIYPLAQVVHWNTADVSWASRGYIDAGDLAAIASQLGRVTCYGLYQEVGLPNCGTWYCDVTADGYIDMSDIAAWAAEGTLQRQSCQISKVAPVDNVANILAWFGMRFSTETIPLDGIPVPRVDIVNPGQMERAIADPYGYHERTAENLGALRGWGEVKALYR